MSLFNRSGWREGERQCRVHAEGNGNYAKCVCLSRQIETDDYDIIIIPRFRLKGKAEEQEGCDRHTCEDGIGQCNGCVKRERDAVKASIYIGASERYRHWFGGFLFASTITELYCFCTAAWKSAEQRPKNERRHTEAQRERLDNIKRHLRNRTKNI